jgi:hypothetical protein
MYVHTYVCMCVAFRTHFSRILESGRLLNVLCNYEQIFIHYICLMNIGKNLIPILTIFI